MFKRVTFEDWQAIITMVAFLITFSTFCYFTVRALMMKKSQQEHMANLPLEEE